MSQFILTKMTFVRMGPLLGFERATLDHSVSINQVKPTISFPIRLKAPEASERAATLLATRTKTEDLYLSHCFFLQPILNILYQLLQQENLLLESSTILSSLIFFFTAHLLSSVR